MFVIITYDIKIQRINRVRKLLRMYLTWTQNSVFEGKITESKLQKCLNEVNSLIDRKEDSIYVYSCLLYTSDAADDPPIV